MFFEESIGLFLKREGYGTVEPVFCDSYTA